MFSNGVLLGLPISELAYGSDSLFTNYTIIIGHAPLCYLVGITLIEVIKNEKTTFVLGLKNSAKAILLNNLATSNENKLFWDGRDWNRITNSVDFNTQLTFKIKSAYLNLSLIHI